jgi:lipoprotein signal peptidase
MSAPRSKNKTAGDDPAAAVLSHRHMSTSDASLPNAADTPQERWAIGDLASHLRLWLFTIAGLALDLWSKDWAFRTLRPGETRVLIDNLCSLQVSLNPGALFGLGAGLAPIFVGASVLALLFVLYLFANSGGSRWWVHIALGLVLAGALGNLYDRTFKEAYVANLPGKGRDIGRLLSQTETSVTLGDFPTGSHRRTWPRPTDPASGLQPVVRDFLRIEARIGRFALWPWIFNIADALLVVGVGVLLINFWFDRRHHPGQPTAPPEPQQSRLL